MKQYNAEQIVGRSVYSFPRHAWPFNIYKMPLLCEPRVCWLRRTLPLATSRAGSLYCSFSLSVLIVTCLLREKNYATVSLCLPKTQNKPPSALIDNHWSKAYDSMRCVRCQDCKLGETWSSFHGIEVHCFVCNISQEYAWAQRAFLLFMILDVGRSLPLAFSNMEFCLDK